MKAKVYILYGSFPTQGYGILENGRPFFLRYRHGWLRLHACEFAESFDDFNSDDFLHSIDFDAPLFEFGSDDAGTWLGDELPAHIHDISNGIEWDIPKEALPPLVFEDRTKSLPKK